MRIPPPRSLLLCVAVVAGVAAGCGGSATPYAGPQGTVALQAVPDGVVALVTGKSMSVNASLFGLAPSATVSLVLERGTCLNPGASVVTFASARVGTNGTVRQVLASSPSSSASVPTPASVSVHQIGGSGGTAVGCTDLSSGKPTLAQRMFPVPTARGGGGATVSTDSSSGQVSVRLSLVGVVGSGAHEVTVHHGNCDNLGASVADLGTASVSAAGSVKETVSGQLSSATTKAPWSIVVLSGRASSSSSSASGPLRPLLCGDVPAPA